ncbi:MAG: glycoside hydrolase family 3 protein, partial [SAR86 cluster bacterium]|nr:glycoside hydrolase family 3 protein [SAR86 cluster bacterium]
MNKLTIKLSILSLILSLSLSAEEDWSRVNTCKYSYGANDNLITELLSKMSIEQKVGQVIQGDLDFISPADVKKYHIGSVLNGGNTAPNRDKYSTADDWKKLSQEFYDASIEVDGVKIPVLWGTDAVHGHNNLIGATLFPHNIGLGATANAALLKDIGEAIALEVLSTGVAWTFAPTVAVPQDDRWGRTYEGFSENPELVSKLGKAMIVGLQGEGTKFLDNNHVIATAKHFMGDGGTINGVDQGDAIVSEAELREIHGYPYFQALDACAQTVMASFNSINGSKMHGDKRLLTGILKDQMQFDGFVVGDWNGHGQVKNCSNVNCAQAFNAGVDMFMVPEEWKLLLKNTIRQVKSGEISLERLDDAVRRILTVKSRMGLLNGRAPHEFTSNYLGHPDHLALARQAVRESLVLLKNNNQMLPLNPSAHVGVIGEAANKISSQTGGWTIT